MEGYKLKYLKLKEFDRIQEMFDRALKMVDTFEDFRTELVEGKEKRAGEELVQEITKKQKKIHKEGKKSYYQIVRADEKCQMYMIFSQMLKNFNRENLEDLYKLVKEDEVWKLQKGYKVLKWKLYDSCRVHFLMMQSM
nr:hypothetical protein [Tanacetum cinerariifolium]